LRRCHVLLEERQYALLDEEADATGLSVSELLRRAVDATYRPLTRQTAPGFELSFGLWRRPDAAVVGRRPTRRLVG
jgi:hypothetical protein